MEMNFTKTKRLSQVKSLSDPDKLEAIRSKDELMTGRIYTLYRDVFINTFRKRLKRNTDILQDIYSEAFCTLCDNIYNNKLNEGNLTSSLKTYLLGIGKYKLMAYERKENSKKTIYLPDIPDYENDEPDYVVENESIVKLALIELGEPCHSLFVMKYWEGKNGDEIAKALSYKNAETVKNLRSRCLQKLKDSLKNKLICN